MESVNIFPNLNFIDHNQRSKLNALPLIFFPIVYQGLKHGILTENVVTEVFARSFLFFDALNPYCMSILFYSFFWHTVCQCGDNYCAWGLVLPSLYSCTTIKSAMQYSRISVSFSKLTRPLVNRDRWHSALVRFYFRIQSLRLSHMLIELFALEVENPLGP